MARVPKKWRNKSKTLVSHAWYRYKAIEKAKEIAKERDNYRCQKCGRSKPNVKIDGSHVYSVGKAGFMATDIENIKALCADCHRRWHSLPLEASEWFNKKFPERAESLAKKFRERKKPNWEEVYNELKK